METTIKRKVKDSTMLKIFNDSKVISVRFFKALDNDDESNPKTNYKITIRHAEESNASKLFTQEVRKFEKLSKTN